MVSAGLVSPFPFFAFLVHGFPVYSFEVSTSLAFNDFSVTHGAIHAVNAFAVANGTTLAFNSLAATNGATPPSMLLLLHMALQTL